MTLAVVMSRALEGLQAQPVRVEVHLANGLPSFTLVGLADTEVREARERVRAALAECGFAFPHNRRVTVNLSPADLPKESGRFDLPIALGILAAAGVIPPARLQGLEFAGELSLDGVLRPIRGALAIALAARASTQTLVLPAASAREAACVPGLDVRSAHGLLEVVQALTDTGAPSPAGQGEASPVDASAALVAGPERSGLALPRAQAIKAVLAAAMPDLADVRGQASARRALEIAAAGRHALLMIGPPGSGKTMLAERLPSILPPMSSDEALESAALQSLVGVGPHALGYGVRPLRSPHHSASAVALVGGGSPPRPGEISLAHHGVLFLDELPEFPRAALEALREPLESGRITISRAARQAVFPARFQLVAAMNPCPCGWRGAAPSTGRSCRCTPDAVARYQSRLSGPLLDRIDLIVEVAALPPSHWLASKASAEDSLTVLQRVMPAWSRRLAREGGGTPSAAPASAQPSALTAAARALLKRAAERLGWSGRAMQRVLNVSRTIADLDGSDSVAEAHVAEAVQFRRGLEST